MVRKTSRKMILDFMYHKSVRRLLKKGATVVKMAAVIACVLMVSGFLHALMEQSTSQSENFVISKERLLLRHQRRVNEDKGAFDKSDLPSILQNNYPKSRTIFQDIDKNVAFTKDLKYESTKTKAIVKSLSLRNIPMHIAVDYDVLKREEYVEKEERSRRQWSSRIKAKQFSDVPPNPSFIFHNKLPKSGSSTMNNILKKLSKQNDFNFLKLETKDLQTSEEMYLMHELKSRIVEPFFLLKHHRFLNFTKSNQVQPTFINVMRDPIEWFTSRYYFTRYGWERKPGCRKTDCGMSEEDRLMDIDECVKKRHNECMNPWMYIQFFCGTAPECFNATTLEQKEKAVEIAKRNILDEYYVIGVLEHFEETLKLFEALLPKYFKDAVSVWKSDFIQEMQRMTKTTFKKSMSEDSKEFFRNGPLHYEINLYNFALELFKEKLKYFNIETTV